MGKISFWKDADKKSIDPRLYSQVAEEMAKEMANYNKKNRNANRRTQIRKFYDEVVRLEMDARRLNLEKPDDAQKWDDILPMVHMLTAKAAYALGRNLVSEGFTAFIKDSVNQIEEPRDLKVFATFFEAFMGFYTQYGPKN